MPKCKNCGIEKNIDDFYFKNRKTGLRNKLCKKCHISKGNESRKKPENWQRMLVKSREYKKNNKEKIRLSTKKQYQNHKEVYQKLHAKYYKNSKNKWLDFIIDNKLNICSICGYNRCFSAIHFHHKDKLTKKKT